MDIILTMVASFAIGYIVGKSKFRNKSVGGGGGRGEPGDQNEN